MDKLILKGMEFYGFHGVLPEESTLGQKFIVDLEIFLDLSAAGKSDQQQHTVNYAEVFHRVEGIVTKERYKLIEALAERIAEVVLAEYAIVKEVQVSVKKPGAPVPGKFEYLAAEIKRNAKR